jgi:hypothetical protein
MLREKPSVKATRFGWALPRPRGCSARAELERVRSFFDNLAVNKRRFPAALENRPGKRGRKTFALRRSSPPEPIQRGSSEFKPSAPVLRARFLTSAHCLKAKLDDSLLLLAIFSEKSCALDLIGVESRWKVLFHTFVQIDRFSREMRKTLSTPSRFTFHMENVFSRKRSDNT